MIEIKNLMSRGGEKTCGGKGGSARTRKIKAIVGEITRETPVKSTPKSVVEEGLKNFNNTFEPQSRSEMTNRNVIS